MSWQDKIKYLVNSKSNDFNHMVCMEELAELQKEVSKMYRGTGNIDNLKEELVDMCIICGMLLEMYGIDDEEMQELLDKKMTRNMERVK